MVISMLTPDAGLAAREADRVRALREQLILGSGSELVFNRLIALTALLFNSSLALLTLVDEEQAWIKASVGMAGLERMHRADTLASDVLCQNSTLLIPDLQAEAPPRGHLARLVGQRFYAGALLRLPSGLALGVLAVLAPQPRQLAPYETELLEQLAALTAGLIQARRRCLEQPAQALHHWHSVQQWTTAQLELVTASLPAQWVGPQRMPVTLCPEGCRTLQQQLQSIALALESQPAGSRPRTAPASTRTASCSPRAGVASATA